MVLEAVMDELAQHIVKNKKCSELDLSMIKDDTQKSIAIALGEASIASGNYINAVNFFKRADNKDGISKVKNEAILHCQPDAAIYAAKELGDEIALTTFNDMGRRASEPNKSHWNPDNAIKALKLADNKERLINLGVKLEKKNDPENAVKAYVAAGSDMKALEAIRKFPKASRKPINLCKELGFKEELEKLRTGYILEGDNTAAEETAEALGTKLTQKEYIALGDKNFEDRSFDWAWGSYKTAKHKQGLLKIRTHYITTGQVHAARKTNEELIMNFQPAELETLIGIQEVNKPEEAIKLYAENNDTEGIERIKAKALSEGNWAVFCASKKALKRSFTSEECKQIGDVAFSNNEYGDATEAYKQAMVEGTPVSEVQDNLLKIAEFCVENKYPTELQKILHLAERKDLADFFEQIENW